MPFVEMFISVLALIISLLLFIFVVDWRYFRDWVVVFLFKCTSDFIWGSLVVERGLLKYPDRFFPNYYDTSILFELWVFPVLCVLYNQITMRRGIGPIIGYAVLFSAGITAIEYLIERYTNLIYYIDWTWFTTFYTLIITFLTARAFIAFFRFGCNYFEQKQPRR